MGQGDPSRLQHCIRRSRPVTGCCARGPSAEARYRPRRGGQLVGAEPGRERHLIREHRGRALRHLGRGPVQARRGPQALSPRPLHRPRRRRDRSQARYHRQPLRGQQHGAAPPRRQPGERHRGCWGR
ncbi:hypothetical protein DHEL01_v210678 [Diaporthe helianthi]|uniref:Uncharacterized protein n=1 Tax=Diaporthe helianthi TaxID=158607 RepID=A0A2P5HL13_DIAHE|nr:hypothetical protein DHEL01_v210678 [Diaporthe helianthi]